MAREQMIDRAVRRAAERYPCYEFGDTKMTLQRWAAWPIGVRPAVTTEFRQVERMARLFGV